MYRKNLAFVALLSLALVSTTAFAADPGAGTISPASPATSWQGGPFLVSNPASCLPGGPLCDNFSLTIVPPASGSYLVTLSVATAVPDDDDYDLAVYGPDGALVDGAATGSGNESVSLVDPPAGTYRVEVQPFLVASGSTYDGAAVMETVADPGTLPKLKSSWDITYHGECCEGNLAAEGDVTYVLLPVLLTGNKIRRSLDGGQTWETTYPLVDISVPFGIEGDLRAFGDDVVFFGTELTHGVAAVSDDRGESWTVTQIPVAFAANDQAWLYMGPGIEACPVQTKPYVLTGWYRIGSVALFSCDGGLTWPIQTPLAGANGDGPVHVVCQTTAHDPGPVSDTRVADANFKRMKSGRHGGWGTDARFYWSEVSGGDLFVCKTGDFGVTWEGIRHPLAAGTPAGVPVTALAFDDRGTLYVLHADKLYVSFDQGESFAFVHTLPRWGNDFSVGDPGSAQFFVVDRGTIHVAIKEAAGDGGDIWYLRGKHVDTGHPKWKEELVDSVGAERLDFLQIAIDGNGIPTIGYTTPPNFDVGVTTASRSKAP